MRTQFFRNVWVGGMVLLLAVASVEAKKRRSAVWEQAGLAYGLCAKMYSLNDWAKAASGFDQFVTKYPTNQNVPVAYVQLADCYFRLGKGKEALAALDTVTKKFGASRMAGYAWGRKLDIARAKGDRDKWLDLYEEVSKCFGKAPLGMSGRTDWRRTNDYWWSLSHTYFYYPRWRKSGWYIQAANTKVGWVKHLLWAADTPERALRTLAIITGSLKTYGDDLPMDWKYAHVTLLRQAAKAPKEEPAQADAKTPAEPAKTQPGKKAKKAPKKPKYKPVAPEEAETQFQAYLKAYPKGDPRVIGLWMREANHWAGSNPKKTDAIWADMMKTFPGYASLGNFAHVRMDFLYRQRRYDDFVTMARWYLKHFPLGGWRDAAIGRWITMAMEKTTLGDKSQIAVVLKVLGEEQKRYPLNTVAVKANLVRRIDLQVAAGNLPQAVKLAGVLISKPYWSAESFAKVEKLAQANKEFAPIVSAARKTYAIPVASAASAAKPIYDNLLARIADNQKRHMEELGDKLFTQYRNDAYTILGVKALVDYYYGKAIHASRDKWVDLMAKAYPLHPLTQDALHKQSDALYGAKQYNRAGPVYNLALSRFPGAGGTGHWFHRRIECFTKLKNVKGRSAYAQAKLGQRAAKGEIGAIGQLGGIMEKGLSGYKAKGDYWTPLSQKWGTKTYQGVYCHRRAYQAYYVTPTAKWHWGGVDFPSAIRATRVLRAQTILPELAWKLYFEDINLMSQGNMGGEALKTLAARLRQTPKTFRISERLDLPNFGRAVGAAKLAARGKKIFQQIFAQCRLRSDKYYLNIMLGAMYQQAKMYPQAAKGFLAAGQIIATRPIDAWGTHNEAMGCLAKARSKSYFSQQMKYFKRIRTAQDVAPRLLLGCVSFSKTHGAMAKAKSYLKKLRLLYPASAQRGAAEHLGRKK